MKQIFVYGNREKYKNYAEALTACGAMGIFSENLGFAKYCDGLLLTGGADVDPALYHAENQGSMGIDRKRDEAEIELIHIFSESGRPILGICRGLQIINVALGGDLIQDIPTASAHRWEESTGDKAHGVTAEKDSSLYPLYGESFVVNSAHHQAVKTPGEGLSVAAVSEDGVIEALENREKKIYCTQWHPERMAFRKVRPDTVDGRYIFEFFLSKC